MSGEERRQEEIAAQLRVFLQQQNEEFAARGARDQKPSVQGGGEDPQKRRLAAESRGQLIEQKDAVLNERLARLLVSVARMDAALRAEVRVLVQNHFYYEVRSDSEVYSGVVFWNCVRRLVCEVQDFTRAEEIGVVGLFPGIQAFHFGYDLSQVASVIEKQPADEQRVLQRYWEYFQTENAVRPNAAFAAESSQLLLAQLELQHGRAERFLQRAQDARQLAHELSYANLGVLARQAEPLLERGRYDELQRLFSASQSAWQFNFNGLHPAMGELQKQLGQFQYARGQFSAAAQHYYLALNCTKLTLGARSLAACTLQSKLGETLMQLGQFEAGERLYRESLLTLRETPHTEHFQTKIKLHLAKKYAASGRDLEALTSLDEVLSELLAQSQSAPHVQPNAQLPQPV